MAQGEMQEQELATLRDQMLRLQADFENARKRWLKQEAQIQEAANARLLRELVEILDDLERALSACPEAVAGLPRPEGLESFRSGVQMILQRIQDFLESYGVAPIEAVGRPFDPLLHEAVAHEPSAEHPEATVLAEIRRGYLMNGRVLRHSVVKVAMGSDPKRPPEAASEGV